MDNSTYVLDTIAFVKYLEDRLPRKADTAFRRAEKGEAILLIPHIVIGEFIYIALKNRLKTSNNVTAIREVMHLIETAGYIKPVDMDFKAWEEFLTLEIPELHDRMICAIAKSKGASLITPDAKISTKGVQTLWE
jgi:predicted nucleic acid-binding protein